MFFEWSYVFAQMKFKGSCHKYWTWRRIQTRTVRKKFYIPKDERILGYRSYLHTKNASDALAGQAADAPPTSMISATFLWAILIYTAEQRRCETTRRAAFRFITHLLDRILKDSDGVTLPFVLYRDTQLLHISLQLQPSMQVDIRPLLLAGVQVDDMAGWKAGNVQLSTLVVALYRRHDTYSVEKGALRGLAEALGELIAAVVRRDGVPVTDIHSSDQLMPRLRSGSAINKWKHPDKVTKVFCGWSIVRDKLTAHVSSYIHAMRGTSVMDKLDGRRITTYTSLSYHATFRSIVAGHSCYVVHIDEANAGGKSIFLGIVTDVTADFTGCGFPSALRAGRMLVCALGGTARGWVGGS